MGGRALLNEPGSRTPSLQLGKQDARRSAEIRLPGSGRNAQSVRAEVGLVQKNWISCVVPCVRVFGQRPNERPLCVPGLAIRPHTEFWAACWASF